MTTMYHFFCGVHLIGNMADHAAEALKLFEAAYRDEQSSSSQESTTVRLVRVACKAFERHGDEKSGHPLKFATFLRRKGIHKVPLAHFKGNQFNILFHNAGGVYFLRQHITEFLTHVWGTSNKLLKAVLSDVGEVLNTSGCKALGLINKLVTTPLWRLLEADTYILDVPSISSRLVSFFEACRENVQKTVAFMQGEISPFPDVSIHKDEIWECLIEPSVIERKKVCVCVCVCVCERERER